METVKAAKSISIPYQPNKEILRLLRDFKGMVNYCLEVGLKNNVTGCFKLTRLVYGELSKFGYHSWYTLSAIEIATTILKNYRKARKKNSNVKSPKAKRFVAKLGNQAFKIKDGNLVFPVKLRQFVRILLHKRALHVLRNVKLGSITITPTTIHVAYSRMIEVKKPKGWIATDVNEDNVTAVSSDGEVKRFDLSKLKRAGYGYFWRKRKIQQEYARDRRILKKVLDKLSKNYCNLVNSELHKVSVSLAKWCREKGYGLIHENLKGIRESTDRRVKRLNKFNGKIQEISIRDKELKRRLNNWWFRKFLHMANYKCLWLGVKVKPVNPKGSSLTCPRCGSKLKSYPMGQVKCSKCNFKGDRHIIAYLNLLKTSDVRVRFALKRPSNVAVNPALTTAWDEDKLGKPKRGSATAKGTEPSKKLKFSVSNFFVEVS